MIADPASLCIDHHWRDLILTIRVISSCWFTKMLRTNLSISSDDNE